MNFIAPQQPATQQNLIANTAFWPDIDLDHYQRVMRTDGTVTPERLRHAALNAISEVNAELEDYKKCQTALGVISLADVPAPSADGGSEKLYQYQRAVFSITKANLTERYRDIDATRLGAKRAEDMENTIDELWRDARWAMRRIRGEVHMTVELI